MMTQAAYARAQRQWSGRLQPLSWSAASLAAASTALLFTFLHCLHSGHLMHCGPPSQLSSQQARRLSVFSAAGHDQAIHSAERTTVETQLPSQQMIQEQQLSSATRQEQQPGPAAAVSISSHFAAGNSRALAQASTAQQPLTIGDLSCPAWLRDYQKFHKHNRGKPDAKYLVYTARHGSSGLGDRVRAMMFVTRLAYATNRVALFTWKNDPVEPQQYLPPAGFMDWTLTDIPYDPHGAKVIAGFDWMKQGNAEFDQLTQGGLHNDTSQFVSIQTSREINTDCLGCPKSDATALGSHPDICLFHFLFKPSNDISSAVDEELVKLYGPQARQPGFKYVAAHLRLAGMPEEKVLLPHGHRGLGRGPLVDLMATVQYSKQAAVQQGINVTETPVLMLVDDHSLRKAILEGHLADVITTDTKPVHLARYSKKAAEQKKLEHLKGVEAAYVDLLLLARARCLVAGQSGFSYAAWMLGKGYSGCFTFIQNLRNHPSHRNPAD